MPDSLLKKEIFDNRNIRSSLFKFDIYPDQLVNRDICESIYRRVFFELSWEKINANSSSASLIPETYGLYMFVWKPFMKIASNGEDFSFRYILYVGKANEGDSTLRSRYSGEYKNFIKQDPSSVWKDMKLDFRSDKLTKYLNLWDIEYWFCPITNSDFIAKISGYEKELIELFCPPINDQYKPKTSGQKFDEIVVPASVVKTVLQPAPF